MNEPIANGTSLRGGRYVIVGMLGRGSQGATLEAVDKKAGRSVAIKRFDVRHATSWKDVELAEREARVLAQLHHAALPAYVEHFEEAGSLYLVMERIEGRSLHALRSEGRALSVADVERMVREVGAVLDHLHGLAPPVIHRDLKPGNILLRPDGSFAVVDFGAVRAELRTEGGSTVVGTFGYMAPEQFQGRATAKTDVYALGATAMAMLTGRDPEALPHKGLSIDVEEALRGSAVPDRLRVALARMLVPDPDARAASVAEAFRGTEAEGRAEPSVDARTPNRHERRREARNQRREEKRWERRQRRRRPLPRPVFVLVAVALFIARYAVVAATRVAVPVLLHLLARVFGRHLDEVAADVRREGDEALRRIDEAEHEVLGPLASEPSVRTRVADPEDREVVDAEIVDEVPSGAREVGSKPGGRT